MKKRFLTINQIKLDFIELTVCKHNDYVKQTNLFLKMNVKVYIILFFFNKLIMLMIYFDMKYI